MDRFIERHSRLPKSTPQTEVQRILSPLFVPAGWRVFHHDTNTIKGDFSNTETSLDTDTFTVKKTGRGFGIWIWSSDLVMAKHPGLVLDSLLYQPDETGEPVKLLFTVPGFYNLPGVTGDIHGPQASVIDFKSPESRRADYEAKYGQARMKELEKSLANIFGLTPGTEPNLVIRIGTELMKVDEDLHSTDDGIRYRRILYVPEKVNDLYQDQLQLQRG